MDQKLTDLSELTSPAVGDETYIVDTSDTTHDVSGTSKRITLQSLLTWLQSLTGWNASKLQSKDISDTAPTDNQVLTWDNAASKWKPAPAGTASPLTTKGDLYGYDTTNQRIPVGTDGQVLTADSTDDQGVAWKAAASAADVVGEVPTGTPNGTLTDFTIAQSPITGTLRVFVNGIRQKVTDDYTFTGTTITFVSAPLTGDKIQVDYKINTGDFSTGSCSFIDEEVPVGTVDGSNKTFTLASAPVTGSLKLFRDGQLLTGGGADYTLTTNSIAFVSAPVTGSVLRAYYKSAVSTAGNADLLDGQHAPTGTIVGTTDTQTLTNKTLTNPIINGASGTGALNSKIIVAIRDLASAGAPTDVSYTGVGFTPTSIICISNIDGSFTSSWGMCDSSKTSTLIAQYGANTFTNNALLNISYITTNDYQTAIVKSFDADGFTLTWNKVGSPTGTVGLKFLCFK